ncbi:MAG: amidohydrolase family protein, partial [Clostridia bacterium]|nr:amidohydrolase family protein [Clostridia bacterium]
DATGLTLTPGFIDSHAHSDSMILNWVDLKEKVEQGITLSIAGNCGSSPAPLSRDVKEPTDLGGFGTNLEICKTMGTFLNTVKKIDFGSSTAFLVGHSAVRKAVMGMENRKATGEELEKMKFYLRDAMENGATGMSFGLYYTPSCYAHEDEVFALAKIVGEYGGVISSHIRNEGDFLEEAVEEFINIIRVSGARGVISHHKSAIERNWGKVKNTLRMIDDANQEGLDIYVDVYPYVASRTSLSARFIPKKYHAMGLVNVLSDPDLRAEIKAWGNEVCGENLEWTLVTNCSAYPEYEGKRVPEIALLHGKDEYETVYDMIAHSKSAPQACYFTMCEEDIETVMRHPRAMLCTDSGVAGANKVYHPRLRASFPRFISRYVRDKGVMPLAEAIRRVTSLPAHVYGIKNKGLVKEGYDADLVLFDYSKIKDNAEFTNCSLPNDGLNFVFIAGEIVAENGVYNGKRKGKAIIRTK